MQLGHYHYLLYTFQNSLKFLNQYLASWVAKLDVGPAGSIYLKSNLAI